MPLNGFRKISTSLAATADRSFCDIQGDFFNWASPENISRLAPPKNALTGPSPPHFEKVLSMAAERGEILNTFLIPREGGQSGTLSFFRNQSLTGQHLANSGEAQLKKSPCMIVVVAIVALISLLKWKFR